MAVEFAVDTFVISSADAVGTEYTRSFSFDPKAVVVQCVGRSETVDTVGGQNIQQSFGFAVSTTSRAGVSTFSEDAALDSQTTRMLFNDSVLSVLDSTNLRVGALDVSAIGGGTNQVKFVVDDQFPTSLAVEIWVFGGSSITNAAIITPSSGAAIGNEADTGVGFQGDFVLYSKSSGGLGTTGLSGLTSGIGWAKSSTNRGVVGWMGRDAQTIAQTNRYGFTGECIAELSQTADTVIRRADFVSFDADGITLNWLETPSANNYVALVFKGGDWDSGIITTGTSGSVTGLTSKPAGVIVLGRNIAESTQDTVQATASLGIGAAALGGAKAAMAFLDVDASVTTDCVTGVDYDKACIVVNNTPAIANTFDVTAFADNGFDWTSTANDTWHWISVGPAPAAAVSGRHRLGLLGAS